MEKEERVRGGAGNIVLVDLLLCYDVVWYTMSQRAHRKVVALFCRAATSSCEWLSFMLAQSCFWISIV